MPHIRPSGVELQVLAVLWDKGPSSVRAVLEAMPDGKDRAYTTVLSVMQVLEKKGLVGHTAAGAGERLSDAEAARAGAQADDEGPDAKRLRRQPGEGPAVPARRRGARGRRTGRDPAGDPGGGGQARPEGGGGR